MRQVTRGRHFLAVSSFYSAFKLSVGLILLSKVDRGLVREHSAPACPARSVVLQVGSHPQLCPAVASLPFLVQFHHQSRLFSKYLLSPVDWALCILTPTRHVTDKGPVGGVHSPGLSPSLQAAKPGRGQGRLFPAEPLPPCCLACPHSKSNWTR